MVNAFFNMCCLLGNIHLELSEVEIRVQGVD